ncbi:Hcp family type VI secretion system effector [Lelliottia wanjuensis]|jgi:type VI secretion system secreted protein Hcp|uniref:Hcp family type VI secretion system effector n=1 Tax=Lelliottia wanjuensis TaxID=3050585 RepID=UPI002551C38C|nr:type VI secretion system tube protein TssD [Lelliottia sp. V86_10]MDK9585635.1 type VI secretion system tube protein TssD [Lelliottia sp. V86_10]
MGVPAHLWLYDTNGSLIYGDSKVIGREGSIEIQSFIHGLNIPFDGNTGRLTSTRVHNIMSIEKEFDKATPYLYRAVAQSENLQKAIIRWYRINDAGAEEEFFNIELEKVRVIHIHPSMQNFKHPEGQMAVPTESLGLGYGRITWKYLDGNIQFTDEWNSRTCA